MNSWKTFIVRSDSYAGDAADGPKQTNNFKTGVFDNVGVSDYNVIHYECQLRLDVGRLLDLAVTDVRYSTSEI